MVLDLVYRSWMSGSLAPVMYWAVHTIAPCGQMPSSFHDAIGQDALDGAAVELFEELGTHTKSFQSSKGEKVLSCPLHNCLGVFGPCQFVGDVENKEVETLNPLHFSPVDVNGGLFGPPCPIVHDQLICLAHTPPLSLSLHLSGHFISFSFTILTFTHLSSPIPLPPPGPSSSLLPPPPSSLSISPIPTGGV